MVELAFADPRQNFTFAHISDAHIQQIQGSKFVRNWDRGLIRAVAETNLITQPLIALSMKRFMTGIVYELMRDRNIPFYEFPKDSPRAVYGLYMYSGLRMRSDSMPDT